MGGIGTGSYVLTRDKSVIRQFKRQEVRFMEVLFGYHFTIVVMLLDVYLL
jgi:hypothetical protein